MRATIPTDVYSSNMRFWCQTSWFRLSLRAGQTEFDCSWNRNWQKPTNRFGGRRMCKGNDSVSLPTACSRWNSKVRMKILAARISSLKPTEAPCRSLAKRFRKPRSIARSLHTKPFGFNRFRVLTVTTGPERVKSLLTACTQLKTGHGLFLFADRTILENSQAILLHSWQTGRA